MTQWNVEEENRMLHVILISAHTVSGLIAFVAGCIALRRRSVVGVFVWSLIALLVFVAAAVAVDWSSFELASQIVFVSLIALGGYMVWRAVLAHRLRHSAGSAFIDHVGFGLISLFEGFVIVLVLDLGGPGWLVAITALAGLVVGHSTIQRLKRPKESASVANRLEAPIDSSSDTERPSAGRTLLR